MRQSSLSSYLNQIALCRFGFSNSFSFDCVYQHAAGFSHQSVRKSPDIIMISKYLLVFPLLLSSLLCGCSVTSQQIGLVGNPAPAGIYYPLNERPRALSSELGKVVALAFWDANCHHCQREMPKFNTLAKAFLGSENTSFIAISLNRASDESSLNFMIKSLGLNSITHAFSGNDIFDESFLAFKGESVPYFVLIDQNGVVRWVGNDAKELREPLIEILRPASSKKG